MIDHDVVSCKHVKSLFSTREQTKQPFSFEEQKNANKVRVAQAIWMFKQAFFFPDRSVGIVHCI